MMKNWLLAECGLLVRAGAVTVFAVAGLRHEAVDHAVERDVVIKAFARQKLHPLRVLGRDVVRELDDDASCRGIEDQRIVGIGSCG
jgi:hypothetical protein